MSSREHSGVVSHAERTDSAPAYTHHPGGLYNMTSITQQSSVQPLTLNLSDELFMHIANYLPKTSMALFASIFSSSLDDSEPSAKSKAIISSSNQTWECIDFLDIDKDIRMKLTDDDIEGKLQLTHCSNFTERGLQQLLIQLSWNKSI